MLWQAPKLITPPLTCHFAHWQDCHFAHWHDWYCGHCGDWQDCNVHWSSQSLTLLQSIPLREGHNVSRLYIILLMLFENMHVLPLTWLQCILTAVINCRLLKITKTWLHSMPLTRGSGLHWLSQSIWPLVTDFLCRYLWRIKSFTLKHSRDLGGSRIPDCADCFQMHSHADFAFKCMPKQKLLLDAFWSINCF